MKTLDYCSNLQKEYGNKHNEVLDMYDKINELSGMIMALNVEKDNNVNYNELYEKLRKLRDAVDNHQDVNPDLISQLDRDLKEKVEKQKKIQIDYNNHFNRIKNKITQIQRLASGNSNSSNNKSRKASKKKPINSLFNTGTNNNNDDFLRGRTSGVKKPRKHTKKRKSHKKKHTKKRKIHKKRSHKKRSHKKKHHKRKSHKKTHHKKKTKKKTK